MKARRLGELALLTGLFSGYSPVASGTMGTLVGALLIWFIPLPLWIHVALCLVFLFVGVRLSDKFCSEWKEADSSKIVLDEIVGILVTMIGIPVTGYYLIVGFFVFRFFDIVKLPPANYFDQKLKNGWGVMLDDVAAGIYGNVLLHLMVRANF